MLRASRPIDRQTQKRIDKITKQQKHRAMLVGGAEGRKGERVRQRSKGDFGVCYCRWGGRGKG